MTTQPISEFLRECTSKDETAEGLDPDELYGLYVSWCALSQLTPLLDEQFRHALASVDVHAVRRSGRMIYPGLIMIGPAATDYIVNSSPDPFEGDVPA